MFHKILVCVLSISTLAACGTSSDSKLKIIGGKKAPNDAGSKGILPATIGFQSRNQDGCTGVRISKSTFLTAAHCTKNIKEGEEVNFLASNNRKFTGRYKNIQIHPSWSIWLADNVTIGSDVSTFELAFYSRDDRNIFDGFIDISPVDFSVPIIDMPVKIAGWGCESRTGLPNSRCDKFPNNYMKWASSKINKSPILPVSNAQTRYFNLDASSDKPGINGFISDGDSGGPVYSASGSVVGINSSTSFAIHTGEDAFLGYTKHAWLGYPDVKSWIDGIRASESAQPSYYEGFATVENTNGSVYRGNFANGFRNGQGNILYKDGKIYTGNFVNDARRGYGEQTWPAGTKYLYYKGDWDNDLPNGKGTMAFSSGQTYSGQVVDARLEGEGQLSYPNGDVRTGHFVNSKREGEFILVTADGHTYKEQFSADTRTSVQQIN